MTAADIPVIGLHGAERSGKDTVAGVFVARFGWRHLKFADALYEAVHEAYPATRSIADEHKDVPLSALGGRSKRDLLIEVGQRARAADPDHWVRLWREKAVRSIREGVPVICSDVRMDNEAAAVRELGGMILGVQRPGVDFRGGPTSTNRMSQWASAVIFNDGGLRDLERRVEIVAANLSSREMTEQCNEPCW